MYHSFLIQPVLLLKVMGPLQCLVNDNYRVLICCTCHFQSCSLFFILASSVCKSLQCLTSTLTEGGKGGHLFRLTCSDMLWGGRDTANKYCWRVWGLLAVDEPHWLCPSARRCVLPWSPLLRLQGALQGHCLKRALHFVHFPGLSHSGSRALRKGTDSAGHEFCSLPRSAQLRQCQALGTHTVPVGPAS